MSLDPQAQALLDKARELGIQPVYSLPVNEARAFMEEAFRSPEPRRSLHSVEDIGIPGPNGDLMIRVYRPSEAADGCLLFFHGGGWTINSVETHDYLCRELSFLSDCSIVSVDYRLAPEWRYPTALDDAFVALQWVFDSSGGQDWSPAKICVGGDSSGGTLATTVALLNRDRGGRTIRHQLLFYPVTDYFLPGTDSYSERQTGYSLNRDFMIWFWNNYIQAAPQGRDPYLCPLREENFESMPPALILTAEYDPLRDEGRQYAEKLTDAGIAVEHWHYQDQMHGFLMQTRAIDRAQEALESVAKRLKEVINQT